MSIEQKILTALETYQWTQSAVVYNFANHLNYSEAYVRRQLENLVEEGKIEKIREGTHHGQPRYIYRLTQSGEKND